MQIGHKIKEKRIQLGLTQEELGNRCELTKGFISQIENDKTDPSIQTLKIILDVLGITLTDFFKEEKVEQIVYTEEEQLDTEYDDYVQSWLIPTAQNRQMEPILQRIKPDGSTLEINPFEGEIFGYVISGEVILNFGSEEYDCHEGESFYFKADKVHFLNNKGNIDAVVLLVATPPHF